MAALASRSYKSRAARFGGTTLATSADMVGKPNLPRNAESQDDIQGAAIPSPGLTPLDQEREASMADEGGAAGAIMESQDGQPLKASLRSIAQMHEEEAPASRFGGAEFAGLLAAAVAIGFAFGRRRNRAA